MKNNLIKLLISCSFIFLITVMFNCSKDTNINKTPTPYQSTVLSQVDTLDNVIVHVDISSQGNQQELISAFESSKKIDKLIKAIEDIEIKNTGSVTVKNDKTLLLVIFGVVVVIFLGALIAGNRAVKIAAISGLTIFSIPFTLKILDLDIESFALFPKNYYTGIDNAVTEIIAIDSLAFNDGLTIIQNDSLLKVKAVNISLKYLKYSPNFIVILGNEEKPENEKRINWLNKFLLDNYLHPIREDQVLTTTESVKSKYRAIETNFNKNYIYIYFLR